MEYMNDSYFFSKLELVLNKLISLDFRISDDTVFQKLFDSISNIFSIKECQGRMTHLFVSWISSVITLWKVIHINSRIFALRLISLVCQNENGYYLLKGNNNLSEICNAVKNDDENNFSLTAAFIDIISSCSKHGSGRFWVFEMGCWKDILYISIENRSLYVLRKSRSLIAEIVLSQMKDKISASQVLLNEICDLCYDCLAVHNPMVLKNIHNKKEFIQDSRSLNPVILLREVLLHMLEKGASVIQFSIIDVDRMEDWIWRNVQESENLMVLSNISKLLCVFNIINVPHTEDGKVNYSFMCALNKKVINHCSILIRKKEFGLVQEACVEYLILWNKFGKEIVDDIKESTIYSFESTPFTILSIPVYMFLQLATVVDSDVMDGFDTRESSGSCVQTKQIYYLYRESFRMDSDTKIQTLAVSVIHCYIRIVNIRAGSCSFSNTL